MSESRDGLCEPLLMSRTTCDPEPGDFDAELETIPEADIQLVPADGSRRLTVVAEPAEPGKAARGVDAHGLDRPDR